MKLSEAIEAYEQGKRVRLKFWPSTRYIAPQADDGGGSMNWSSYDMTWLCDDWEIYDGVILTIAKSKDFQAGSKGIYLGRIEGGGKGPEYFEQFKTNYSATDYEQSYMNAYNYNFSDDVKKEIHHLKKQNLPNKEVEVRKPKILPGHDPDYLHKKLTSEDIGHIICHVDPAKEEKKLDISSREYAHAWSAAVDHLEEQNKSEALEQEMEFQRLERVVYLLNEENAARVKEIDDLNDRLSGAIGRTEYYFDRVKSLEKTVKNCERDGHKFYLFHPLGGGPLVKGCKRCFEEFQE